MNSVGFFIYFDNGVSVLAKALNCDRFFIDA